MSQPVSRRAFTRLFTAGGSAALFTNAAWAAQAPQEPALPAEGVAAG